MANFDLLEYQKRVIADLTAENTALKEQLEVLNNQHIKIQYHNEELTVQEICERLESGARKKCCCRRFEKTCASMEMGQNGGLSMERLTDERAVIEPGTYLVSDDLLDDVPEIRNVSKKELYYRLGLIENALGKNYDLGHLRELIEADREGRVKILPESTENTCGTCENFLRIEGTKRGHCKLKPLVNSQYGMRYNIPFEPSQSRKACKNYEPALKAMKESNNEKDN